MSLFAAKTDKAREIFLEQLIDNGFSNENISCEIAWDTFKQFKEHEFECDEDAICFETGIYDFDDKPLFYYCMTRQFTHEKNKMYAGMEQLILTVYFEASPLFEDLNCIVWSFDFVDLDSFYEVVENSDHLKYPPTILKPLDWSLNFKCF